MELLTKPSAIIAPSAFEEPNWNQLRALEPERAAAVLGVILKSLDAIEEKAFAVRGEAMLLIEERNLFRFVVDEEVGDYYQSFDKFLKDTLPRSWGYCRDALRTRKECREISYADYVQIPRCNSEQLKKVSSNVRALPAVIEAAQTLPEKAFVAKVNKDHNQHIETTETFKWTFSSGEAKEMKAYGDWIIDKASQEGQIIEEGNYREAYLYLATRENEEHGGTA